MVLMRLKIRHRLADEVVADTSSRYPDFLSRYGTQRIKFWEPIIIKREGRALREYAEYVDDRHIREFEQRLQDNLGQSIGKRLEIVLLNRDLFVEWEKTGDRLTIVCTDMRYGSLEVILAAFGLEKYAGIVGATIPGIMALVESNVPGALRDTLGLSGSMEFSVEAEIVPEPSASVSDDGAISPAGSDKETPSQPTLTKVDRAARSVQLLLASYLLPISITLLIGYVAFTAMRDATKSADDMKTATFHEYVDFAKAQSKSASDERVEIAKLASSILSGMETDRRLLTEAMMKMATDVNRETVQALHNANEKPPTTPPPKVTTTVAVPGKSGQ